MFKTVAIFLTIAAAIPPLDSSQLARVEVTDQRSQTVHEAGFYALLENARDWPDQPTTATAGDEQVVLPDFDKIMTNPEAWQGRLVTIEGTLEGVLPNISWSRAGWEHVQALIVRVGNQQTIVYLTQPPALTLPAPPEQSEAGELRQYVAERGMKLKLVARFFKLVEDQTRGRRDSQGRLMPGEATETRLYPVFVGRQVMEIDSADGDSRGLPLAGAVPLLALLVAGCVFLLYYRVRGAGRRSTGGMSLAEYRERKQRERQGRPYVDEVAVDDAPPSDLPDDPATALDALAHDEPDVDADTAPPPHDR